MLLFQLANSVTNPKENGNTSLEITHFNETANVDFNNTILPIAVPENGIVTEVNQGYLEMNVPVLGKYSRTMLNFNGEAQRYSLAM